MPTTRQRIGGAGIARVVIADTGSHRPGNTQAGRCRMVAVCRTMSSR